VAFTNPLPNGGALAEGGPANPLANTGSPVVTMLAIGLALLIAGLIALGVIRVSVIRVSRQAD
jgi:hypothetical protein